LRKSELWIDNFNKLKNPVAEKWLNFYSPNDPIAYPLQQLFTNCANLKTPTDVEVDTGWSIKSHTGYWENMDVAKEIAKILSAP